MDRYATLRHGLIGAWCPSLGATGYTLRDISGSNLHGTLVNMNAGEAWSASGSGLSLKFDGVNDRVETAATTRPATISVSVWVNHDYAGSDLYSRIIEHGLNDSLTIVVDKRYASAVVVQYAGGNPDIISNLASMSGWTHICLTVRHDGTNANLILYINGREDKTGTFVRNPNVSRKWFFGGGDPSVTSVTSMAGNIDDIRLYNRVLTPSEVLTLASRRGIGLLPTRHRLANVLGSQFWLRDAGTWKKATGWIKVGGVWTKATPKISVGGVWK